MKLKSKNPTLTNMKMFHRSLDWPALWEEWYLAIGKSGLPKHRSILRFADQQGNNPQQKSFLRWYLGPKVENDPDNALYPWTSPQDWQQKRETGGWCSKAYVKEVGKEIRREINALDSLRSVGNTVILNSLLRQDELETQLDKEFGGAFMSPNLSMRDNEARARVYLALRERIINLKAQTFDLFAKSLGVNFQNMEGFAQLMTASATASTQSSAASTRLASVMAQILEANMVKHARYGIPLAEETQKVIEAQAAEEPAPSHSKKRKDVQ